MDELRESSLLFSLEGLLETERERVQREAREAERRREEELERVQLLAERRRVAAQQEREARERRQVLELERDRLEQERIDAMKQAAVERARIEAEAELRLVELEQARKHELSLVSIREQERAAHYRALSWLSSGACVLALLGGSVAYFGFIAPAHARTEQQLRSLVESTRGRASMAERALDLERKRSRELEAIVAAPPARPVADSATPSTKPKPSISPPGSRPGPLAAPPPRPCKDDGDPLSPCLNSARRRAP